MCWVVRYFWVVFSLSIISVFLICLLSCVFQREPTWMALYSLIVLMCHWESTHSLILRQIIVFVCRDFVYRLINSLCCLSTSTVSFVCVWLQQNWQKLFALQHDLIGIDNIVQSDRVCAACIRCVTCHQLLLVSFVSNTLSATISVASCWYQSWIIVVR